jgi:hypothetical protein
MKALIISNFVESEYKRATAPFLHSRKYFRYSRQLICPSKKQKRQIRNANPTSREYTNRTKQCRNQPLGKPTVTRAKKEQNKNKTDKIEMLRCTQSNLLPDEIP